MPPHPSLPAAAPLIPHHSHPFFCSEGGEVRPARRAPGLDVDSQLRCNLIIALGDLALRFPNTVEPYTGGGRGWCWKAVLVGEAGE